MINIGKQYWSFTLLWIRSLYFYLHKLIISAKIWKTNKKCLQTNQNLYKAIEEICENARGSYAKPAAPQGHFFEKRKKKHFYIWSTGVCVPNFRCHHFLFKKGFPVFFLAFSRFFVAKWRKITLKLQELWTKSTFI